MHLAVLKLKKHFDKQGNANWVRLLAAEYNMEGRKMRPIERGGEIVAFQVFKESPCPSFRKEFLVAESSDYTFLSDRDFERFLNRLKWLGFTHFKWADAVDEMEPMPI